MYCIVNKGQTSVKSNNLYLSCHFFGAEDLMVTILAILVSRFQPQRATPEKG
jgi:hypothetical protein